MLTIFVYWAAVAAAVSVIALFLVPVILGLVPWLLALSVDAGLARIRRRPRRLRLSDPVKW